MEVERHTIYSMKELPPPSRQQSPTANREVFLEVSDADDGIGAAHSSNQQLAE